MKKKKKKHRNFGLEEQQQPAGAAHLPSSHCCHDEGQFRSWGAVGRMRSPRDLQGCQLNLLLQKWKWSPKRQQKRINLQTKTSQQKSNGEEKRENRTKWPTKELRMMSYLQKMETLKNEQSSASDAAGEREASLINITHPVLSVVPVSLLAQSRGIFFNQLFGKWKFFSSFRNSFKKEGILGLP